MIPPNGSTGLLSRTRPERAGASLESGGSQIILAVMALLAATAAISRTVRLRRDRHRQN
jgi:hypothetical protein